MKPTNSTEEIFPCNKCGNHAQPSAKTESRKKVVIHDKEDNEHFYLLLTNSQVALLEWLEGEYIFDNDRYEWEVLNDHEFKEI
jgi:methionyl-tRNA synthetase